MTCLEFGEISELYASAELGGAEVASCEAHLDVCASCAREFKKMRQADAALRSAALRETVETSVLDARVREYIEKDLASHAPHAMLARRPWAVAALGLAAAAALYLVGHPAMAPQQAVLAAAAQDHQHEVTEHALRHWVKDPRDIAAFAAENGITQQVLSAIVPAGYHLDRAKRCPLDGVSFVHLVYSNGQREFSVFLHANGATPAGQAPASARAAASGVYAVDFSAGHVGYLETPRLTALVVNSDSHSAAVSLAQTLRSSL